ncbi:ATP-dependent RNA helicase RhlE [Salinimicrobium sediminis]|uniref:DEAD-box ATP-dependent RNA helicase RhpA n=1 Tax=Salinimicrobium sediminis TaxID=1343891 RepID=A0A285X889_9FLAO|nr:DEAD/DEAH box helicase [Salinimicrobium sediminis]SOC81236.1 ATP-dependent RNA helicase RhlE [Salinimicrobium sediminis]
MSFKKLDLDEVLLKALDTQGYTTPTPIQTQAIPVVLSGKDLLGVAQTGTGKTAAFGLPILQLLSEKNASHRGIKALILTPTRELAIQIDESLAAYGKHTKLSHAVIFGGVSQNSQTQQLKRGVDILVATPGRLLDLMNQGFINLKQLQIFVLDEADRMLDMGFIHDVKKVIKSIPEKRQTLFFSATMPEEIQELAKMMLKNPVKIEVTPPSSTVDKIQQRVYFTNKPDKRKLLLHLLQTNGIDNALVFTRTKHGADKVARFLDKAKISSAAIHGNKSQNARQNALKNFKNGNLNVLVATDIAARGIDIDELTHVFNFDLPNVPETYVHRIGRTGRAGNDGVAISFCAADERKELKDIEKLASIKIPVIDEHPFPMDLNAQPAPAAPQQRNRNNNRNRGRR